MKSSDNIVKSSNREFYNKIAESYEEFDGRRKTNSSWIDSNIKIMRDMSGLRSGSCLDLGCGSGFMMRKLSKQFKVVGVDISDKILVPLKNNGKFVLCCDIGNLPFKDKSFDYVTCFAVLHHCCLLRPVLSEVFRVLKDNGVLYIDHDINKRFVRLFRLPLFIYRSLFRSKKRYLAKKKMSERLYEDTEFRKNGIDFNKLGVLLREIGFSGIRKYYHFLGLNRLITMLLRMFNLRSFLGKYSPLVSVFAVKRKKIYNLDK